MNDFMSGHKRYNPDKEGYGSPFDWKREFFKRISPDEATRILNEEDPYEILGIKRNATRGQIRSAYYKKAMEWHPDRNPDKALAEEMMKKINAAYSLLT